MYSQIHRPIYTNSCTYLFFTLYIGFHAVVTQPKFFRSCPHHIRGLIRLALAC